MVDFLPAAHVHDLFARLREARQRSMEQMGAPPEHPDHAYWESLFEAHAAAVLEAVPSLHLPPDRVIRYRCFGQQGRDLRVRPFVMRRTTEVREIRRLIDWHPPPDAMDARERSLPTQDVELLYRHFSFDPSPAGVFDYWAFVQELWGSTRWIHSTVIASAEEFGQRVASPDWVVHHPVERCEPAVVCGPDSHHLAVLVECPLDRFEIQLHAVTIDARQAVTYGEPVLVASGPRGWMA